MSKAGKYLALASLMLWTWKVSSISSLSQRAKGKHRKAHVTNERTSWMVRVGYGSVMVLVAAYVALLATAGMR